MDEISWVVNQNAVSAESKASIDNFCYESATNVMKFHSSFKEYERTPLVSLKALAHHLGVSDIFIKDESYRFGLNAFKVLGGSYAIGRYIAQKCKIPPENLDFSHIKHTDTGKLTFVTATDGNHGRGVAWTAKVLGHHSVVYMPDGSSLVRLNHIKKEGADAKIMKGLNYDDCVRLAAKDAEEKGWIVVQDTAWEGYEYIPTWIMQGYGTMALEALLQMKESGVDKPTHIFIQAGVGSLAGAIQGFFSATLGEDAPIVAVVEPHAANCLYQSKLANKRTFVTGEMNTIMAGLACGEPNTISWDILNRYANLFISCGEEIAATGMRILGNPLSGDKPVISGESGAVTLGLVNALLSNERFVEIKSALKIDENAKILLFSTEGDTDPVNYRNIVWGGDYPSTAAEFAAENQEGRIC